MVQDSRSAGWVYDRIKHLLPKSIVIKPKPFTHRFSTLDDDDSKTGKSEPEASEWRPTGLNEQWRFCRYEPPQHFSAHFDGAFIQTNTHM